MAKYCGNCGRELADEAKFCPNCGQEYIPRYKADHYSKSEEFDGPFDDFDNRSSTNPFESSSKKSSGNDKKTVEKVFSDLAVRFEKRNGGYTQILKLGERRGDDALMVVLRLVEDENKKAEVKEEKKAPAKKETKKATKKDKEESK
jgi:hypothetical protein